MKLAAKASIVAALGIAFLPRAFAEETIDSRIGSLIRSLGYGAGIHDFKNYVLRGDDDYRKRADEHLAAAEKTIGSLRDDKGIKDNEKAALADIEKVVKQYHANLATAQKMVGEGKSAKDIDAAVKVDDAPALAGLAVLKEGRKWTALDNLEAALGYGGAIHDFKNFVLRGKEEYKKEAVARFKDVTDAIAALRADKALGEKEKKALDDIDGVVKKYSANLETVQKMHGEGKSVKEIDTAVKVDDAPATTGLAALRK